MQVAGAVVGAVVEVDLAPPHRRQPLVAAEARAGCCCRGADGSGAAAAFALEAGLVALKDALRAPTDAATAAVKRRRSNDDDASEKRPRESFFV